MGEISGKYSDLSVITSDNPRYEEPLDIIEDIKKGINKTNGKYIVIWTSVAKGLQIYPTYINIGEISFNLGYAFNKVVPTPINLAVLSFLHTNAATAPISSNRIMAIPIINSSLFSPLS